MTAAFDIAVFDFFQTDGAAAANGGQFEFPPVTVGLVKVEVFAMRESDLACKGWTLESLVKRIGSGALVVQETIPTPPNLFASAADATALAAVNIALFTDNTFLGVTCTGQANDRIFWSVKVSGRRIT